MCRVIKNINGDGGDYNSLSLDNGMHYVFRLNTACVPTYSMIECTYDAITANCAKECAGSVIT